jgi:lipid A 4'-phosphatase
MNRKLLFFGLPVAVLTLMTILIAVTGADMKVSAVFHQPNGWPIGDEQPWRFFYRYGYYPAYILAGASLGLLIATFIKPAWAGFRKYAAFMVLLLLLGPGLLVNTVFKDHWGRPRPREITQSGGTKQFHHPWERGEAGNGRAFPSGHGASAFYLAMPFFALHRRKPRVAAWIYAGGMLYGVMMGIARIAQGGHFVSDILWAWGVVHLTAVTLYFLMGLHREEPPSVTP